MEINGKEIKFLRTVKTTSDIANLCPDRDINRIAELFSGALSVSLETGAKFIHYLNEGYEMNKHYFDKSYEPQIISVEEIMYLDDATYTELITEAMASLGVGAEQTIEVEPSKKNIETSQESN